MHSRQNFVFPLICAVILQITLTSNKLDDNASAMLTVGILHAKYQTTLISDQYIF